MDENDSIDRHKRVINHLFRDTRNLNIYIYTYIYTYIYNQFGKETQRRMQVKEKEREKILLEKVVLQCQ